MVGFSWLLTRYYEDRSDRERLPTIVTVLGLSLVLASVTLVPVDIFILSSTVDASTGQRYDWATSEEVARQTKIITDLYYALYTIMSVFTFIVIPFAYFYFEEYEDGRTTKQVRRRGPYVARWTDAGPHAGLAPPPRLGAGPRPASGRSARSSTRRSPSSSSLSSSCSASSCRPPRSSPPSPSGTSSCSPTTVRPERAAGVPALRREFTPRRARMRFGHACVISGRRLYPRRALHDRHARNHRRPHFHHLHRAWLARAEDAAGRRATLTAWRRASEHLGTCRRTA